MQLLWQPRNCLQYYTTIYFWFRAHTTGVKCFLGLKTDVLHQFPTTGFVVVFGLEESMHTYDWLSSQISARKTCEEQEIPFDHALLAEI